jgi:Tol biopolymer transport system component
MNGIARCTGLVLQRSPALVFAALFAICCANTRAEGTLAVAGERGIYLVESLDKQPQKLISIEASRPIAWSPDAKHILFWKQSKTGWDIWRCDTEGKDATNLTKAETGGCRSPAYSPDGSRIAFMRDDPAGVYIMDADGSNQKRLTTLGHRDVPPSWSPDSKQIAFVATMRSDDHAVAMVVNVADSELILIGVSQIDVVGPSWSADSNSLLWCKVVKDKTIIAITDIRNASEKTVANGDVSTPAWSPDQKTVAYVDSNKSVHLVTSTGLEDRKLFEPKKSAQISSIAWSPDGKAVGVTTSDGLFLVDTATKDATRLQANYLAWKPQAKIRSRATESDNSSHDSTTTVTDPN